MDLVVAQQPSDGLPVRSFVGMQEPHAVHLAPILSPLLEIEVRIGLECVGGRSSGRIGDDLAVNVEDVSVRAAALIERC